MRRADNEIIVSSNIFQINEASTLSWSTRIKGFAVCFVVGILLTLLGSFALFFHAGLRTFAVFYTLGNILSMASTCFLMGPLKQMRTMFASTRVIATCLVVFSLIMTLVAALVVCIWSAYLFYIKFTFLFFESSFIKPG